MSKPNDRIFQEMTKKAMVILRREDGAVFLACEDHPITPLREHFDEGYMECEACSWRITLEQARTLVNDVLVKVSELFDLLDYEETSRRDEETSRRDGE